MAMRRLVVDAPGVGEAQAFPRSSGIAPGTTMPDELSRCQTAESAKWAALINTAGIEPE